MRTIGELCAGERVATPPSWHQRRWTALYMRTQGIGDVILATGVLRAIALAQPTIELEVLTTPQAAPVLEGNPHVRRVRELPRSIRGLAAFTPTLRRTKYDIVIDGKITRGASFIRSPALMLISRAPYRVGVGGGNHHLVFNLCVDRFDRTTTHMIEGSAALATPFGVAVETTDFRPEIFLSSREREVAEWEWSAAGGHAGLPGERWLINISAGAPLRRWPDDRWVTVIAHLRERRPEATVVVMGIADEWRSVCNVAYASGAVAVQTNRLRAALAMVGTSTHVITSDTSITHVASAFCIPTVVLIQRGLTQWLPWKTPYRAAYWSGATIDSLTVDVACDAVDGLLTCSYSAVG